MKDKLCMEDATTGKGRCWHPLPCPYHPTEQEKRRKKLLDVVTLKPGEKQDLLDLLSRLRKHLKSKCDEQHYIACLEFLRNELVTDISMAEHALERNGRIGKGGVLHSPTCSYVTEQDSVPICSCGADKRRKK